jgi:hypothetical protein
VYSSTANFSGNRWSQPLILRPVGRSAQELPSDYQVEPRFMNFSVTTAKKGYRQWPGSGNFEKFLVKASISYRQYHRTITKIMGKSHRKTNFLCAYPCLFWDWIWIRLRIRGRLVKEFSKKSPNWRSYSLIEGERFMPFGFEQLYLSVVQSFNLPIFQVSSSQKFNLSIFDLQSAIVNLALNFSSTRVYCWID